MANNKYFCKERNNTLEENKFYEVWSEAGLRNPAGKFIFSTSRILQSDLLLTRTIIGIFVDCALPDTHASHLSRQYTRQTHFLRYS